MLSKNVKKSKEDHYRSNILSEICKGDKRSIEELKRNSNYHWSNITIPRTKETPLHLAAQYGHSEIISFLINEFVPKLVDIRNVDNKTPLHEAAQFGRVDCVKILVDSGADINAIKRSDWTPLMLACTKPEQNYEEIVQYLVDKGALLNFKNKDGWTCLHLASRNENPAILQCVSKRDIDFESLTKNGRTALHISALHGNLKNVEWLTSKIDVNSVDYSGNSPFHEAVLGGNIEVIDYIAAKVDSVSVKNKTGYSVLHLAAASGFDHILEYLVNKYDLDLNGVNCNGYTSLHCAAKQRHFSTFKLLVKLGANTRIVDKCGRLAEDYLS